MPYQGGCSQFLISSRSFDSSICDWKKSFLLSICSPHASEAGVDCTQSRVQAKLQHYGPPPGHSSPPKHLIFPSCLERLRATSPRHVGRFALSQQIHCAQTQQCFRPRLSFTDCTPVSLLRSGHAPHVRFVPAGR